MIEPGGAFNGDGSIFVFDASVVDEVHHFGRYHLVKQFDSPVSSGGWRSRDWRHRGHFSAACSSDSSGARLAEARTEGVDRAPARVSAREHDIRAFSRRSGSTAAIVRAIVTLAHAAGMTVTAEGIDALRS